MSVVSTRVQGDLEARRKMEQIVRDLKGEEYLRALRSATLLVERSAKLNAPVDSGRLKNSITSSILTRSGLLGSVVVSGVVGSNVFYAPMMELGTGTFVGRPPHRVPSSALNVWARRHGFPNGFLVARAIMRRGGLEPRNYFQRAFESNKARIVELLGQAVERIVVK